MDARMPNDVAAALSKALGKHVNYVDVPIDAAARGLPEWIADG